LRVEGGGWRVEGAAHFVDRCNTVQGAGCRLRGAGCRLQGAGCRLQGAGCRLQGAGCRVQGAGCRVQGAGFRVQGAGISTTIAAQPSLGVTIKNVRVGVPQNIDWIRVET